MLPWIDDVICGAAIGFSHCQLDIAESGKIYLALLEIEDSSAVRDKTLS